MRRAPGRGVGELWVRGPGKTRPSAGLTPGAEKRRPAGPPGSQTGTMRSPRRTRSGLWGRGTALWSPGTRGPQRPPAPGCTERPSAVPEHPPGRSTGRPRDPGPRERIPQRRPDARGPNSPQDHQLPVFHRLLVGGAGLLLAGGKHGATFGRRSRLHRDPRRVRAAATLPSRERGERAGKRHGGERGAGRPVPRLLRRGCARRPPAPSPTYTHRGRREPDSARNASGGA